jgi:Na+:H+ antiporter, NhaA family
MGKLAMGAELFRALGAQVYNFGFEAFAFSKWIIHWINDGLIAVFFFVVGLEIKRELLVGELASARQAALPIAGALGGVVAPALLYLSLNASRPGAVGWGIPIATDIAFAVGAMALLGSRVPAGLKVFLTALANVDDIVVVLVIAAFYTGNLSFLSLGVAGRFFAPRRKHSEYIRRPGAGNRDAPAHRMPRTLCPRCYSR